MSSTTQNCFVALVIVCTISCYAFPDTSRHDRVRIHIPTKIKTVYKTKYVKIPEHHHYFHEKVKEVPQYIPISKEKLSFLHSGI